MNDDYGPSQLKQLTDYLYLQNKLEELRQESAQTLQEYLNSSINLRMYFNKEPLTDYYGFQLI